MKRTKRIFIRHAESEYNAGMTDDYDSVITENGARQVARTAQYLARSHSDPKLVGYVSPYRRALETAMVCTGVRPGGSSSMDDTSRSA